MLVRCGPGRPGLGRGTMSAPSAVLLVPRGRQQRPLSFPPQGQVLISHPVQTERLLYAQNREKKKKKKKTQQRFMGAFSVSPALPPSPFSRSSERTHTVQPCLFYQMCFLQFCPLGRHDGGGLGVLQLPTIAPGTRPLS